MIPFGNIWERLATISPKRSRSDPNSDKRRTGPKENAYLCSGKRKARLFQCLMLNEMLHVASWKLKGHEPVAKHRSARSRVPFSPEQDYAGSKVTYYQLSKKI